MPATSIVVITLSHNKTNEIQIIGKMASPADIDKLNELAAQADQTKDYSHLTTYVSSFLKQFGNILNNEGLNNLAWQVFTNSKDKAQLEQALSWSKLLIEKTPNDPGNLDTYANLLYKLGKKDQAIEYETRAMQAAPVTEQSTYQVTLEKMKKGEPTW